MRKVEDYETALNRYCSIVDKFDSMDSTDIYLMGFGFECFKSAIFIQVIAHAGFISHRFKAENPQSHLHKPDFMKIWSTQFSSKKTKVSPLWWLGGRASASHSVESCLGGSNPAWGDFTNL